MSVWRRRVAAVEKCCAVFFAGRGKIGAPYPEIVERWFAGLLVTVHLRGVMGFEFRA